MFHRLTLWFAHNNSETIKAITLAFCSIQQLLIRDIRVKFGIPNSPHSPGIGQNSDGAISGFPISGQSLLNKDCHDSRTSDDIDMKLRTITKLDNRNTATSKKLTVTFMSRNCGVVVTFPISGQFGGIQKADSRGVVCETSIFINSNLFSYKN